jgi:hypothetical protein
MRPTVAQTAGAASGPIAASRERPPARAAEAALDGWFRIGPLSALRKLTLFRLACGVPELVQSI